MLIWNGIENGYTNVLIKCKECSISDYSTLIKNPNKY